MAEAVTTNDPSDKVPNGSYSTIGPECTASINSQYCQCKKEAGETTRLLSYCCEHSGVQSTDISLSNEQSIERKMTRRQCVLLVLITYGNFWISTCYSLLAPFFPTEARKKGVSPTIYGFIFGVFQLILFITSPLYGKVIPITTSRFLLVSGMFVSSACSILFGALYYSPDGMPFILTAFAVRIVEALGTSAYYVAALTLASSEFTGNRATILALLESATGIGLIVGPTVGGALYQVGGYTLPFFVLGGILFVGSLVATLVIPHSEQLEESGNLMRLMRERKLYIYWIIFAFCFCIIGYNDATLSDHLRIFNFKPILLASVFIIPGGLYAIGSPIWGFLCDKCVKPEICGFIGSVVTAVAFIFLGPLPFLGLSTKLWMVILSLVLLGIGLGGMIISSFILSLNNSIKEGLPDDVTTYALVSGVFSAMGSLGAFIGPSVGGIMLEHIGYENSTIVLFGISSLMVVVALVNMFCSFSRRPDTEDEHLPEV